MRTGKSTGLLARLALLVSRGNTFIFSLGEIFVRDPEADKKIDRILRSKLPAAPSGQVFVKWGLGRKKPTETALLITGVGRLGNSIIQTLNAATLARSLGASVIFYHRFDAINNQPMQLGPNVEMRKLPLFGFPRQNKPQLIWRTYALDSEYPLDFPCSAKSAQARHALRIGLFGPDVKTSARPKQALTIYLRSGDVFTDQPEPHYGQPPWAFYEKVLEYKDWSAVELVAEDHGNPNRDLILKWCEREGLEITEYGEQLSDAVQVVLTSSNLVTARGTFIPALVFLSEGPKNIFQFHDERNPLTCRRDVTIFRVTDTRGDYISSVMSRNWVNSAAQRTLMVSYPKESLSPVMKDLS